MCISKSQSSVPLQNAPRNHPFLIQKLLPINLVSSKNYYQFVRKSAKKSPQQLLRFIFKHFQRLLQINFNSLPKVAQKLAKTPLLNPTSKVIQRSLSQRIANLLRFMDGERKFSLNESIRWGFFAPLFLLNDQSLMSLFILNVQ